MKLAAVLGLVVLSSMNLSFASDCPATIAMRGNLSDVNINENSKNVLTTKGYILSNASGAKTKAILNGSLNGNGEINWPTLTDVASNFSKYISTSSADPRVAYVEESAVNKEVERKMGSAKNVHEYNSYKSQLQPSLDIHHPEMSALDVVIVESLPTCKEFYGEN